MAYRMDMLNYNVCTIFRDQVLLLYYLLYMASFILVAHVHSWISTSPPLLLLFLENIFYIFLDPGFYFCS
jgi:hypothetical protein